MKVLVSPNQLPDYGYPQGNRQRQRLEAAGLFPKRVMINSKRHAYVEAELIEHSKALIAARDAGTGPRSSPPRPRAFSEHDSGKAA